MDVPADLRLVEEFLNTLDERSFARRGMRHTGGDALPTPEALSNWLADHTLVPVETPVSKAELAMAHDLRSALRAAMRRPLDDEARQRTNAVLAAFPLRAELGADGEPRLIGPEEPVPAALAELVAIVVRRSADGNWARLRACAAPDCRWVFYDDSRNGAGRWCSMTACGNRLKTARYRERKALT